MRMLLPTPTATIDVAAVYAAARRGPVADRPWVIVNMIGTVDGATTDAGGLSGGLGGAADRQVLSAVRGVADLVVAGAGTVRAEDYGPARTSPEVRAARVARGQSPRPRIVVVSASLHLDPTMRLFRESAADPADERPLIVTVEAADAEARQRLGDVADVVVAGDERVDWPQALAELRRVTGAGVAVVEGGPSVNGQLVAADLVDEMCLTVAPVLVGGESARIAHGSPSASPRRLALEHVLEADGYLWLRYMVDRTAG